jgi:hypothetical protein
LPYVNIIAPKTPQHVIHLKSFYIICRLVTNVQIIPFTDTNINKKILIIITKRNILTDLKSGAAHATEFGVWFEFLPAFGTKFPINAPAG